MLVQLHLDATAGGFVWTISTCSRVAFPPPPSAKRESLHRTCSFPSRNIRIKSARLPRGQIPRTISDSASRRETRWGDAYKTLSPNGTARTLGSSALAVAFIAAAIFIAGVLPDERNASAALAVGLTLGYVLIERVRFEFGGGYGTAEQLVLVPILLLAPLPYVPFMAMVANAAAIIPEVFDGRWHRERLTGRIADLWSCSPVIILAAGLRGSCGSRTWGSMYWLSGVSSGAISPGASFAHGSSTASRWAPWQSNG